MRRHLPLLVALVLLLLIYLPTLQTIPNGSDHYFMIDVGETQIVLNVWGTLHATGYPLYVLLSAPLVTLLRAVGVDAAAAPALTSLLWGLLALAGVYVLGVRILGGNTDAINGVPTEQSGVGTAFMLSAALQTRVIVATGVLLLGLTRTIWIHHTIAEIYTFGMLLLVILLNAAFFDTETQRHRAQTNTDSPRAAWESGRGDEGRLYLLALIGGFAVMHHRALIMAAPALLLAVWRDFLPARTIPRKLVICLLLGLIGFLPYAYLPLRAWATDGTPLAQWVYGDPGTWGGFWDQFFGREASRFIGSVNSWDGLIANADLINQVLITDLTLPGLIAGGLGLIVGLLRRDTRHTAGVLLLNMLVPYVFHVIAYTDILSALIIPVLISIACGWMLLAHTLITLFAAARPITPTGERIMPLRWRGWIAAGTAAVWLATQLYIINLPFVREQTSNPEGLRVIELARGTPPDGTLMITWGPRYFAAAFAQIVRGDLAGLHLVDDKADVQIIPRLIVPEFTRYRQPLEYWSERFGQPVYAYAVAPGLVELSRERRTIAAPPEQGIEAVDAHVTCADGQIVLTVDWAAGTAPSEDLSVYVHLLDAADVIFAQGDVSAPVFGWRPTTTWGAGELVRDVYVIRATGGTAIRYGMYRVIDGDFENVSEYRVTLDC
jgi:hypothetical protein